MKIKTLFRIRYALIVLLVVTFAACNEEESKDIVPVIVKPTDPVGGTIDDVNHIVYATFNENVNHKTVANILTACGPVTLSDGTKNAYATGLSISGNDFYISGYEDNSNGTPYAKYWKNSEIVLLTDSTSTTGATAADIEVVDDDIYVVGNIGGRAVYWKNGEVNFLTDHGRMANAFAIAVADGKVYVGGSVKNNFMDNYEAAYWVNGEEFKLGGEVITSIFARGSDVYMTGHLGKAMKYFKNFEEVSLNESAPQFSGTSSVFVSDDNDVYVAAPGMYWLNGVKEQVMNNGKQIGFGDLKVLDGVVYGAAIYSVNNIFVAAYWKNGEVINITDGTHNAIVSDLEVIKN